jgi:O-antigen/teichoic acid export membrane protein
MAPPTARKPLLRWAAIAVPLLVLCDQAIVSGGNFLTTVVLGRLCGEQQLGLYRMGTSLMLLAISFPASLVWTPFNARSPAMSPRRLATFTRSARTHVLAIALVGAAALVLASFLVAPRLSKLLWILAGAVSLILLRENLRRMAFARMDLRAALVIDGCVTSIQLVGLAAFYSLGWLDGATAFLVVGLACATGLWVGWGTAESTALAAKGSHAWRDFAENWTLSRYVFVGALLYAGSNGAYPWILAFFNGQASVGQLTAAEGTIFLANPLLLAAGNFFGPAMAHVLKDHGCNGLRRSVGWHSLLILAGMLAFAAVLSRWGDWIAQVIYGPEFSGLTNTIVALSLSLALTAVLIPVRSALFALHEGRVMVWGGVLRLLAMATLGVWAVRHWGPVGVGIGMAGGDSLALALKTLVFLRATSGDSSTAVPRFVEGPA